MEKDDLEQAVRDMDESFRALADKLSAPNPQSEWRYFMEKAVIVAVTALGLLVFSHLMSHPDHRLRLDLVTLTKDVAQNAKDIEMLIRNGRP